MKKIFILALAAMALGLSAYATTATYESSYTKYASTPINVQIAVRGYLPALLVDALKAGHGLSIIPKAVTNAFPLEICPPVSMNRANGNTFKGYDLDNMTKCTYNAKSHKVSLFCKDKYGSAYDMFVDTMGKLEAQQTKIRISAKTALDMGPDFSGKGLVFLDLAETCGIFDLSFPLSRVDGKDYLQFNGTINGVKIWARVDRNMLCTITMKTKLPLYEVALKETRDRVQSYRFLSLKEGFGVLYSEPTGTNTYRMQAKPYPGSHLDVIYLPDGTTTTNAFTENLSVDDNGYAKAYFGRFKMTLEQKEGGTAQMKPIGSDLYELSAVEDKLYYCPGFEDQRGNKYPGNPAEVKIEGNTTIWPIFLKND